MSNEVQVQDLPVVANIDRPMSTKELLDQSQRIHDVLKLVMVGPTPDNPQGVHYGIIPGTDKPTLYQAGAEKICATFRLAPKYEVEDLCEVHNNLYRYRVKCSLYTIRDSYFVGSAMGEASSMEEKYQWEKALNERHYELTDPSRKRIKFKKNDKVEGGVEEIMQVQRNCADLANTVLKIAVKRAFTSATKNATAASDLLDVDLEEEAVQDLHKAERQDLPKPKAKAKPAPKLGFRDYKGKHIDDPSVPLEELKWFLDYVTRTVGSEKRKKYEQQDREFIVACEAEIAKREKKEEPKKDEPVKPLERLPMDDDAWNDLCALWYEQGREAYQEAAYQMSIPDPSALPSGQRNAFQDRMKVLMKK